MDKVAKAIVAGLIAAYGIYEFATTSASPGGQAVVAAEWTRVAVFGIVAGLSTWAVPNKTPDAPKPPARGGVVTGPQTVASSVKPLR